MKVKFNKDFLINELELPGASIYEKVISRTRWSLIYEIVFEYEGKFYRTEYSEGATESQDERPWQYKDEVECIEVEKRKVEVEKWFPIEEVKEDAGDE